MALKLPVGQKRLTNVAVVRMKCAGMRFEIACYKNKVLNWREGIEKDINEVLQTDTVFSNVSKAVMAKEKDLQKAFGTVNLEEICRKILKSGDLQVSDKEREVHMESLFKDIVQIVVERCVHPQTGRQLTAITVEQALKTIGFSLQPEHSAKKQALKAIDALESKMPESFSRAKMRLRIACPERLSEEIRKHLREACSAQIEAEEVLSNSKEEPEKEMGNAFSSLTFLCDPSHYRELDRLATVVHANQGVSLQVLTQAVLLEASGALAGESSANSSGYSFSSAPLNNPSASSEGYAAAPGAPKAPSPVAPKAAAPVKKGMKCSACAAEFEDANEYRSHCRSEWHNFNLKRKVKGLAPVSEEQYAEIGLDLKEGFHGAD
mmetsp:Transcript_913/g.1795  ORF Transcript_913/g.1795 Transcript_913/m.1795 type:complete len:378 (+) Transcript_913:59-1192(+)